MTFRAHRALKVSPSLWPSGPNELYMYDHRDPVSWICMTFRTQSAAYVWPSGPSQLHMYDLQDPVSCRGIATTAWLPWFCLLNHVTFGFTFKGKYKKEKETKENLGWKCMAETRKASCVGIGLHCLFPVSAYIVCFLYRPPLSVSCIGLYRLFPVSAYIVCFLYRPPLSVSCICLYCLFPVSAYIVCFLYRPILSVCCIGLCGLFAVKEQ